MDPGRFSVCVIICLIGTTHLSGNEENQEKCLCSKIPLKDHTKSPLETCIDTASRFRYACAEGYVRKAGTSNLLKCKGGEWTESNLNLTCIRHPSLNTSQSEPTLRYRAAWTTAKPNTTTQLPNSSETSTGLRNESSSESTDSGGNKKSSTPAPYMTDYATSLLRTMESATSQYIPQNSTHSTFSTIETILPQMDRHESMVTGVGIGVTVVILTCSMIGLFFICRRRRRHITSPSEAEMEPMNGASAKVL